MLINCVAYRDGAKLADIATEDISDYIVQPGCFVWVALRDASDAELADVVADVFGGDVGELGAVAVGNAVDQHGGLLGVGRAGRGTVGVRAERRCWHGRCAGRAVDDAAAARA